jgi:hypothetical protein
VPALTPEESASKRLAAWEMGCRLGGTPAQIVAACPFHDCQRIMNQHKGPVVRHLTDTELAGLLDDDLPGVERMRAEAHLEACAECRAETIAAARLVREAQAAGTMAAVAPDRGRRRRWQLGSGLIGLATAAGIAMLFVWPAAPAFDDGPAQERFGADGTPRIDTYLPRAGSAMPRDSLSFSWASVAGSSYRITVAAEDGALLWSHTLQDTVVVPPAELGLPAGRTFFWYVDAIGVGVVGRSGARTFRVAP